MKTISVKEAAEALGVSPRAVQYKLQNGDLKGTRTKNQYGVAEWRVWPNKEIAEAIVRKKGADAETLDFSLNETETVEAEDVSYNETDEVAAERANWRQLEVERLELMAEKLLKPLAERVEAQAVALSEQERVIEDQRRQLRLLPDLQKQAEDERKAAELRALQVEALNKQIFALEEERLQLSEEKQQLEMQATSLEMKANEAVVLAADVEKLKATVEELRKPWWKKLFSVDQKEEGNER